MASYSAMVSYRKTGTEQPYHAKSDEHNFDQTFDLHLKNIDKPLRRLTITSFNNLTLYILSLCPTLARNVQDLQ